MRRSTVLALSIAAVGAPMSSVWAKGGGAKPAAPRAPAAKPVALPAGCERLVDGRDYAMSLDGTRLAFARWVPDPTNVDYHAQAIPKSTVWVRTLATKKDAKVSGVSGVPAGWTTAGGLCLTSGVVVDPATGKALPRTAVMPIGAGAEAIAWTRDGARLAYAADWTENPIAPPVGVPKFLTEIDAAGTARPLDFGDAVYPGEGGTLAWSSDGKRLAFNIPFFHTGRVPPRRTGFVDLSEAEPKNVVVAEISQNNGIPGLHEARRPMRPHPGTTGPVLGGAVWNGTSTLLAYVHGEGGGNADVWLYDVATEERRRQTTDGVTKWSPALDPAGRRVAYLTGKVEDWNVRSPRQLTLNPTNLRILDARLHVLDVVTGAATDHAIPGEAAYPGHLTWTPDGTAVLYEIHGGNAEGTYVQAVAAAAILPSGGSSDPRSAEVDAEAELVAAIRSDDSKRIEVACANPDAAPSPALLAAMHDVLPRWIGSDDERPAIAILAWVARHEAKVALPDVRAALLSPRPRTARAAVDTVVALDAKDAIPDLDGLRAKTKDAGTRVLAAGAMARLGEASGLPDVERGAKATEPDVRALTCAVLRRLPSPKSVEILLSLVPDDGHLYWTHGGHIVVGDKAVGSLLELTGVFFRRDLPKWQAWWKDEAKGALPSSPDPAEARAEHARWMDEREEAYQAEMKKKLPPGFGGK